MNKTIKAYKVLKTRYNQIRPILQYGLVKDGTITLIDLDISISMPCDIKSDKPFLLHIPTLETAIKLGLKNIKYDPQKNKLVGGIGMSINHSFESIEDFPIIDMKLKNFTDAGTHTIFIKYKDVFKVAMATSKEESRYSLNGIAFYSNGTICATDGRRLHIVGKLPPTNESPIILPSKLAKLLKSLKYDGCLSFNMKEDMATISGEDFDISIRAIAGKFPDIRAVIPKQKQPLSIPVSEILPILKTIKKSWKKDDLNAVKFNGAVSWNNITFPIKTPEDMDHKYSFQFLLDAIEVTGAEFLTFPSDNTKPIKIEHDGIMAIVTPMLVVE